MQSMNPKAVVAGVIVAVSVTVTGMAVSIKRYIDPPTDGEVIAETLDWHRSQAREAKHAENLRKAQRAAVLDFCGSDNFTEMHSTYMCADYTKVPDENI